MGESGLMARAKSWGLFRQINPKTKAVMPTWYAKRDVPLEFRGRLGRIAWKKSTGETDYRAALRVAEGYWKGWGQEIASARVLGPGALLTLENVQAAIEGWRRERCRHASGADYLAHFTRLSVVAYMAVPGYGFGGSIADELPDAGVNSDDYYFARHPDAARTVETPVETQMLVARLVPAIEEANAYADIADFDSIMDAAIDDGGGRGVMMPSVRALARPIFAGAWLEVLEQEEAERRRAAMGLRSRESASGLRDGMTAPAFHARVGDQTVQQVIDKYVEARNKPDTEKQYGHIFRALKELCGPNTPIRAIQYDDVIRIRRMLTNLPANASKIYPKLSLADAVERGGDEDKPKLKPNTVRGYLVNLSAVMNFARLTLRCIDVNPVDGLIPARDNQVERRAFTRDELETVFHGLGEQRAVDSAHYWVPAALTYTGGRANEICQLHVDDIDDQDGIPFIDLTLFGRDGRRVEGRRLKNKASARAVPIHKELMAAGFLDFVERRRAAGEVRLFPELTQNAFGLYSHEVSRRFGIHCDHVGLSEPSLTLHGLRHGFRDACRAANLPTEIADGLGGWSAKGVGAGYGRVADRSMVKVNAKAMARLTLGGFNLPR